MINVLQYAWGFIHFIFVRVKLNNSRPMPVVLFFFFLPSAYANPFPKNVKKRKESETQYITKYHNSNMVGIQWEQIMLFKYKLKLAYLHIRKHV